MYLIFYNFQISNRMIQDIHLIIDLLKKETIPNNVLPKHLEILFDSLRNRVLRKYSDYYR